MSLVLPAANSFQLNREGKGRESARSCVLKRKTLTMLSFSFLFRFGGAISQINSPRNLFNELLQRSSHCASSFRRIVLRRSWPNVHALSWVLIVIPTGVPSNWLSSSRSTLVPYA